MSLLENQEATRLGYGDDENFRLYLRLVFQQDWYKILGCFLDHFILEVNIRV